MSEEGLEKKYIQDAFDTNWVVPLGPNVDGFEKDLEDFIGNDKKVVALVSGTAAVHLSLVACGVGPGDEVLVQSFTFCASTHPITYVGATPIMIDSEADTWNIDPELLEEAIKDRISKTGRKPKAIMAVYLYGMPAKIDEIMAIHANTTFHSSRTLQRPLARFTRVGWLELLEISEFCRSMVIRLSPPLAVVP